jgi:hypothetical protein
VRARGRGGAQAWWGEAPERSSCLSRGTDFLAFFHLQRRGTCRAGPSACHCQPASAGIGVYLRMPGKSGQIPTSGEHGTRWVRLGTRFGVADEKNRENSGPLLSGFGRSGASPYQAWAPIRHYFVRSCKSRRPASCNVSWRFAKWNRIRWLTGSAKKLEPGTAATPISFASQ